MGLLLNSGDIRVRIGKELGEAIALFASYDFRKDDRVSNRGLRTASTRRNTPQQPQPVQSRLYIVLRSNRDSNILANLIL